MPPVAPSDGLRPFVQAFPETVTGEGHPTLHGLGVHDLVQRRSRLPRLAFWPDVVFQPEVQRVHPQFLGDFVSHDLQGEMTLRRAQGPARARRRAVGVGEIAIVSDVGTPVQVKGALTRPPNDSGPEAR